MADKNPLGHRLAKTSKVLFQNTLGPGIGVDQQHRPQHQPAAHGGHEDFSPDRAQRKPVILAALTAGIQHPQDRRGSDGTDNPAAHFANRPIWAAAEQLECRIHRRNRAPTGRQKRRPAPDQQSAQRHDERRNAAIGDQPAVERADASTKGDADDPGDDPDERIAKAQKRRQPFNLSQAHDHCGHADNCTDRQVNIAGDDDQYHARRHDSDGRGLDRQVPQVPGRQENPAVPDGQGVQQGPRVSPCALPLKHHTAQGIDESPQARKYVEPDPDQQKRPEHSQQAGVNFGGTQKTAEQSAFVLQSRGGGFGVGHVSVQCYATCLHLQTSATDPSGSLCTVQRPTAWKSRMIIDPLNLRAPRNWKCARPNRPGASLA